MEALRVGSKGPIVVRWKQFLRGLDLFSGEMTDEYDEATAEATERFQALPPHPLYPLDGIAGNDTIGKAMVKGFQVVESQGTERSGPNWPVVPNFPPMNQASRQAAFGAFNYKHAPTTGNPEGIQILGDWQKDNITTVEIPQLRNVKYTPSNQKIAWNTKVIQQIKSLFAEWEKSGLLPLVLTWGGSWNPRFIRGSKTSLSNHSWGTAFDINVPWNGLGVRPALVGQTGSVRELVPLANQHGFYWGGHFKDRPDGMHFEIAQIL